MGYRNREIELKLEVKGETNLKKVNNILHKLYGELKSTETVTGNSKDVYWKADKHSKADFVRLRFYDNGRAQLTAKETDRGSNFDRVEIDLEVNDAEQAHKLMTSVKGKPQGSIQKRYYVYILGGDEHTTVSVYQIKNDKRVFVEVEGKNKKKVYRLQNEIQKKIKNELVVTKKSLYQLFVKPKSK